MDIEKLTKKYDTLYNETDRRFLRLRGDPYDHDDRYTEEFSSFIDRDIKPLLTSDLSSKDLDDLIRLSEHMYETNANSIPIDGSGGECDLLLENLSDLWSNLLKLSNENQRESFHRWFLSQDQNKSELIILDPEEFLEEIMENL